MSARSKSTPTIRFTTTTSSPTSWRSTSAATASDYRLRRPSPGCTARRRSPSWSRSSRPWSIRSRSLRQPGPGLHLPVVGHAQGRAAAGVADGVAGCGGGCRHVRAVHDLCRVRTSEGLRRQDVASANIVRGAPRFGIKTDYQGAFRSEKMAARNTRQRNGPGGHQ